MDRLWAPWRLGYIQSKKEKACFFCKSVKLKTKNFIVINNKHSFAMLNKYPYNNGHLLIAPLRHVNDTSLLTENEIIDIFRTLNQAKNILNKVLKPQGFNIGINTSSLSGAGITAHLHIHIVPRWKGDTNFMPVVYNTKIVSQSLDDLYRKLKKSLRKF